VTPELGVIEGRLASNIPGTNASTSCERWRALTSAFYHYGPKADPFLRRQWHRPHPRAEQTALAEFGDACRTRGLRFGVALTPVGVRFPLDRKSREDLERRVPELDEIAIDDLVILFDDQRGDLPRLA
jgi:hyaluronoglucosaminidase